MKKGRENGGKRRNDKKECGERDTLKYLMKFE